MITKTQRIKLEQIKPRSYKALVVAFLAKQGVDVSEVLVASVYLGSRENLVVADAIVKVFNREHKKAIKAKEKINKELGIKV